MADALFRPDDEGYYQALEATFRTVCLPSKSARSAWCGPLWVRSGLPRAREREQVLAMARNTPNIVGVFMDDFFQFPKEPEPNAKLASLTVDELRAVQRDLKGSGKKLDLFVTLYTQGLDHPIGEYLELIDVITFWTRGDRRTGRSGPESIPAGKTGSEIPNNVGLLYGRVRTGTELRCGCRCRSRP